MRMQDRGTRIMLCALIMAGGQGTRFWPLSTEEKPKQFLRLLSEDTMIQMTVKRLEKLIPIERIFIVTGKKYVSLVNEQLPNLPNRNIIIEPVGKNTAPCIALSAFYINKIYENATIAVLPADHLIKDEEKFIETLSTASEFVNKDNEAIITIGMKPDRPETGYGYINFSAVVSKTRSNEILRVEKFVEKPDFITAQEYLKDGHYLWNGGMFIWKVSNILKLTSKYLNNTYNVLSEIAAAKQDDYDNILLEKYKEVDSVSVDYGIMEKANNIYVIPGDFGWDDVGSWSAVERYKNKDIDNNICVGKVKNIEGSNNLIISSGKQIVIAGMNDIFVVESDEMILISNRQDIDNLKEIRSNIS